MYRMDKEQVKVGFIKYFGVKIGNFIKEIIEDEVKCIYDERLRMYDQVIFEMKVK